MNGHERARIPVLLYCTTVYGAVPEPDRTIGGIANSGKEFKIAVMSRSQKKMIIALSARDRLLDAFHDEDKGPSRF